MSFTAPIVIPPAPPAWARNRQRTLAYHEVVFFFASDEIQTIKDFWDTFITQWGCGIEYGREIFTEITWPGWHVYDGTYWFDYRPYLNPEDPTCTSIAANENRRFSYILKHRLISKSVCTGSYLAQHAYSYMRQGITMRLLGVSENARYPHLSGLASRHQSWWYELSEDQDEDFSTLEDVLQWRQAATIPNAITGNNTNGSSHNVHDGGSNH